MKRPLVGLVVLFGLGIWVGSLAWWPLPPLFAGAVALLLLCGITLAWQPSVARWPLAALLVVVGWLACTVHVTVRPPDDVTRLLGDAPVQAALHGVVATDPAGNANFLVAVDAVRRGPDWEPATGRVYTRVARGHPRAATLRYGDEITTEAAVRPADPARNPGGFDLRRWLAIQGVSLTAVIGPTHELHVVAPDRGSALRAWSLRLRDRLERALNAGVESEPEVIGVLVGMVLGKRSEIPPEAYVAFQQTGVFHVFTVSGLHVGMVTMLVIGALRLVRVPRRWCGIVALPLLAIYVFATGMCAGAVRSLVMAAVFLAGLMILRPTDLLNTLAAAALAILVVAPQQLFNAGFILSYGVVAALILLGPPIDGWLQARFAPDPFVPAELLPRWRRALQRPLRRLCQSLGVSTAAWVGLLPLMAVYFHLFSPVTVPANILVVPALSLITMVGGLSILVYPFWPGLAVVFNNANYFLLWLMLRAVEWLGRLPGGFWFVPAPAWWFVAAYYLALLALLAVKVERRWRLAVAGAGLAVCALGVTAAWLNRDTTVTVLDVDRGLAVFVDRPGTRHDVLVDAGDERDGARAVLPALRGAGVDSLGGGVVTRGVKAHAAGFGPVLAQVPVGAAWYPGGPRRSVYQGRWLDLCQVANLKPATLRPGEAIALGRGARLWALDQAPGNARGRRAAVLVLMLEVDGRRVLLMSDTSPRVEDALLAASNDLRAAVVVRRVHGREPGFSEAFLAAVQPQAVVLVVSSQSAYHPNWSAVQRRLIAHGINVQRTVETGAVQLFARRGGWDVDPWLPEWPGGVGCGVRGEGE